MTDDDPDVINLDKAKARRGKWQNDCIKSAKGNPLPIIAGYSPRARSPVPIAIGAVLARPGKAVAATTPYVTGVTDWPENPIQYGRAG